MTGRTEAAIGETLGRIERENPRINAFTAVYAERAVEAARGQDGRGTAPLPLAGIPFAVKELFDVAGRPNRAGSRLRADDPPAARDATAVERMCAAGAILVGALNMDEFAYGFTTENAHYGPTRNPRDPARIVGGSSGGSAAAVAAGLVPIALGSDTNGSVRVPAALCGVYGLKPTYGRVSRAGVSPLAWSFDHVGVLAGSVRDVARALDAIQGPDPRDPACATETPAPTEPGLGDGIKGLRIAVAGGHFAAGGVPEVFAATARVARALGAGRTVEVPEADRAVGAALLITSAEAASLHLDEIRTRNAEFDPHTRARWIAAAMIPSVWVDTAQRFRRAFQARLRALFGEIDVLITPTTPFPPPLIGQSRIVIEGREVPVRGTLGRFTAPFSFVGLPALSVPVPAEGAFPLGVQLVAAPGRDGLLLRVAETLRAEGMTFA